MTAEDKLNRRIQAEDLATMLRSQGVGSELAKSRPEIMREYVDEMMGGGVPLLHADLWPLAAEILERQERVMDLVAAHQILMQFDSAYTTREKAMLYTAEYWERRAAFHSDGSHWGKVRSLVLNAMANRDMVELCRAELTARPELAKGIAAGI